MESIIAAARLNCRVRYGTGCFPSAMGTNPELFATNDFLSRQSHNKALVLGVLLRQLRSLVAQRI